MKWEYKVLASEDATPSKFLNELGADGWELVSVIQYSNCHSFRFYFKRPIAPVPVEQVEDFKLTSFKLSEEEESWLAKRSRFTRPHAEMKARVVSAIEKAKESLPISDENVEIFLNGVKL